MPYYTVGDYYGRGDYYRGDGIFGTIGKALGGIAKVGLGAGIGLITGGPGGAVKGALGAGAKVAMTETQRATLMADVAGAPTPAQDLARQKMLHNQAVMRAMMNRDALLAARGAAPMIGAPPGMLDAGTMLMLGAGRRRRRMNVTNTRALRRALRRTQGFAKLARRYLVVARHFKKGRRRKR